MIKDKTYEKLLASYQRLQHRFNDCKDALQDIVNWDEEMEDKYEDPGSRAKECLDKIEDSK